MAKTAATGGVISADVSLPNHVLDSLFQRYSIKQRRAGLESFLVASILFDLWALLVPQGSTWFALGITTIILALNITLTILLRTCGNTKWRGAIWEVAPYIAYFLAAFELFNHLCFRTSILSRDSLGWAIVLHFLIYITMPVQFQYRGIQMGVVLFVLHIAILITRSIRDVYFWQQQIANIVLVITAILIGLLCYYLNEAKQRRAFLEAKQSLEVKMVIEEQSAEQERLLLSVLPEHVAVKVRQDLGSNDSEQFKKIYMSRHENVSILYADIVGFTAISSTYSAQDLVKMLNELFARFDRLAEKYHQLRIKILGDCYYCISGAIERPDHAVLCVHMGLSMVKAIKYVQQKTNSPVDMRVGVHTGAVLAGILGQRQWQYDVYSKDVELANKMESSGMAGRVHISERTLNFLNGEFEVEPAYGEKREETLRIAGIKTYYIKKILKPFVETENPPKEDNGSAVTIEADGPSEDFKDEESKCETPKEEKVMDKPTKEDDFKNRLRKELVSRDGHGELSKDTTVFLRFTNKDLESSYEQHREPLSSVPLVAFFLVHLVGAIYSSLILPSSLLHFAIVLAPLILISIFVFLSIAESFPNIFPESLSNLSKSFNDINIVRRLTAILLIICVGATNLFDMIMCSTEVSPVNLTNTIQFLNQSMTDPFTVVYKDTMAPRDGIFDSSVCLLFPSYFSNFTVLVLVATSLIAQLSHICKIILMCLISGLHCYVNVFLMKHHFQHEDIFYFNTNVSLRYSLSALLIAVTIALGFLSRHMDKVDRVIFKWKNEVAEQKEKAADMRHRNEKLVYNILPVHVAEHFISNKNRSYDDLYSQSYEEVGVLFASMPNFSDFYSEDTVNNQGLECLRFLNEVISDFDALLGTSQYQDVTKIKTIGSTYMAASGLNTLRQIKTDDSSAVRWDHLATMVEFALDMKKALQCINEQSFNHFVLKMGINHGPITAGVIGARKPHYDIWGNTVNVASRMESTGKAGAIQVTEETCQILRTFGYTFEQRGLVAVKGKGQLMTYYLQGKSTRPNSPQTSPVVKPSTAATETGAQFRDTIAAPSGGLKAATSPAHSVPSPTIAQSSVKSPMSSISNSPSSVRINQNYDPHDVKKQMSPAQKTSAITNSATYNANKLGENIQPASNLSCEAVIATGDDGASSNDLELDNSEDADRKPLLDDKHSNSPLSKTNSKHTEYSNHDGSGNEKVALINNHN